MRELRAFHKALADVNRLRIVRRLADGEATVTELIEHVGLSQPLVSWHLGRLRLARLVETRRSGRETICRLRPETFDEFAGRERSVLGLSGASPATRPMAAKARDGAPGNGANGTPGNGANGAGGNGRAGGTKSPAAAAPR